MSVGGRIIEIIPMTLTDEDNPSFRKEVIRLWCVDRYGDETCVFAEPAKVLPSIGEEVWWQSGKIMFDGDRQTLTKVGYSFAAPGTRQ